MALLVLIRHGMTDEVGRRLTGRTPGVHLNARGVTEATHVARRLRSLQLAAVYSSPLERARETAEHIAGEQALPVSVRPGLNELEFGTWTGLDFDQLRARDDWRQFHVKRSAGRPPGGESLVEVQRRMLLEVEGLRSLHAGGDVALVSHGDPLRALVCHYLNLSIDELDRFELHPGSISVIDASRSVLVSLNDTAHLVAD